ncbi:hypothetical protein WME91_00850 [Sorangium sp. So ce269]
MSRTAAWSVRARFIARASRQVFLAGSYSSALARESPDATSKPPATSTCQLGSSVAV